MAELPKAEIEEEKPGPLPEACGPPINQIASYQMHLSDAYLSMACYFNDESEMPAFYMFLEDQAEVKRFNAKQFLKHLTERKGRVRLPEFKRPDIDNWGSAVKALTTALDMEKALTKMLEDLNTLATEAADTHLLKILEGYLIKQKRNEDYLEREIDHQKKLEKMKEEERLAEEAAAAARVVTAEGSAASLPLQEVPKSTTEESGSLPLA